MLIEVEDLPTVGGTIPWMGYWVVQAVEGNQEAACIHHCLLSDGERDVSSCFRLSLPFPATMACTLELRARISPLSARCFCYFTTTLEKETVTINFLVLQFPLL